jgi:hypothetical protein
MRGPVDAYGPGRQNAESSKSMISQRRGSAGAAERIFFKKGIKKKFEKGVAVGKI